MSNALILPVVLGVLIAILLRRLKRRSPLEHLRGPPSSSVVYGNMLDIAQQDQVGDMDTKWNREYGGAWRIKNCLGALQHICQKGGYDYPKDKTLSQTIQMITGPGLVAVNGNTHARQRNVVHPAFSNARLRDHLSTFQAVAAKDGFTVNMHNWLHRTALDMIGQVVSDFDFGALDDEPSELARAYQSTFGELPPRPPNSEVLFKGAWKWMPAMVLDFIKYMPSPETKRLREALDVMERLGAQLAKQSLVASTSGKSRDMIGVLVGVNSRQGPSSRLSDKELTAQTVTLILAGHETTATSLDFMLWELAKRPECQAKIREEIAALRSKVLARGKIEYTLEDLDNLRYTTAAVKESLRLHAVVYHLTREATKDDILPLSEPILSRDGQLVHSIPIKAGQLVLLSQWGFNRLPKYWGSDAETWNPERFLQPDANRDPSMGMYANLMSFSAGIRGCIGWRFAVLQITSIAIQLLEDFELRIPPDTPEIVRAAPGPIMTPYVRGKMHEGPCMPLQISPL
ncbi:cytochrome P450 [Obba rivulosa]|uniref:Cytochrome P450 n=1 Tax=Obba rivulosa TaxID=1052685 RepID=A0A8E2DV25_9APHY|nr:cytochrome P450 [Obba rivulosa]